MADKPIEIFRYLTEQYKPWVDTARDNQRRLANAHARGEEIPDYLLPGRVIMNLTPEQREILSKLTSDEVSKEANPHTWYNKTPTDK